MKTASAISEPMNLLLTNIHCLFQVAAKGELYLGGAEMRDPACIEDAWVYVAEGKIAALGRMQSLDKELFTEYQELDCEGRLVLPGFVDSHTHLVFPRTREREFVYRIQGLSYEEIAARGGGILNSARSLSQISDAQLLEEALERAYEILHRGTTTVEIKSGYGLSLEGELRLLRVARQIVTLTPLNVRTTFLGAHAIPAEYKTRRQAYIGLICEEMLPAVAAEGLADYIDVFCDRGYFTPEETKYILQKGLEYQLPAKIHANELGFTGGVQAGVKMGALSVDHLEHSGPEEIAALLGSETIPTLLPSVSFFLGLPYAPARDMIAAGLPVALATDYNPGSSPGGSMPFVMSLACLQMKLLPEEALSACTINAARAMRLSHEVGSVEVGKRADLLITRPMEHLAAIPYSYASQVIDRVIAGGVLISRP